jgi:L-seryl-tRNA(Ser) seleniumtransferase
MSVEDPVDRRRSLPAVDRVVADSRLRALESLYGRPALVIQARAALADLRAELEAGLDERELDRRVGALPDRIAARLESTYGAPLRRVINATGVFLHTNLGRAPLPAAVARRLAELATAGVDLEFDLATGRRAERNARAARRLAALTGAEDALVTNNSAAALLLALAALAGGREVIVSRGELVEIGGSFRIPEILSAAGARLVEVGTTNRTRLADYERAIGPATALLLKVLPSNYRMTGFVEAVDAASLAGLARDRGLVSVVDEGSGLLRPATHPALADHPSMATLIAAGADLVCGSGDKVAGGPQAGLLVGRRLAIARCRSHPLYRALRPDRLTYAALEEVLRLHLAETALPLERLFVEPLEHRRRLAALAASLGAEIVPAEAFLGGGSAPERPIAGEALAWRGDARLRSGEPPVVGYLRDGRLVLDLRTVDPADDAAVAAAVARALAAEAAR